MPNAQRLLLQLFSKLPGGLLVKMAGGSPIEIRGRTLDPLLQLLWVEGKKQPAMETLSPQDARQALHDAAALLDMAPRTMRKTDHTVISSPGAEIPVRIYYPNGAPDPAPVILYFHQGGNVIGGAHECEGFCTFLADEVKAIVVNVDYRLAPEHRYPAAAEDAIAAYAWALEHASSIGGDPAKIAVAGDSAGGQLSAVITHDAKRKGQPQPLFQLLIYPWVVVNGEMPSARDFGDAYPLTQSMMDWFSSHYFNSDAEKTEPYAAPLLEEDFTGLAPALIYTAGFDPLSDEGKAYADKLEAAGSSVKYKCYEHLTHSFTAFGGISPAARRALTEIAADARTAIA